jgi:hypothetical protein
MKKSTKTKNYVGTKVQVRDMGEGVIQGMSPKYNGTWLILIDGKVEEIHDQYVTLNGKPLPCLP